MGDLGKDLENFLFSCKLTDKRMASIRRNLPAAFADGMYMMTALLHCKLVLLDIFLLSCLLPSLLPSLLPYFLTSLLPYLLTFVVYVCLLYLGMVYLYTGCACAEIIHSVFPKIVDIHNYVEASSVTARTSNWNLLNKKVLKKINCQLEVRSIDIFVNRKSADQIITFLRMLRAKLIAYGTDNKELSLDKISNKAIVYYIFLLFFLIEKNHL